MIPFSLHQPIPVTPSFGAPSPTTAPGSAKPGGGPSFAETLRGYLNQVREVEEEATRQIQSLEKGETTDVHQVMLAVEEANLTLDLLIEIRNRLLQAYQELTRTSL